jgi:hypothetical protein
MLGLDHWRIYDKGDEIYGITACDNGEIAIYMRDIGINKKHIKIKKLI